MYSKATTITIRARCAKLVVLGLHKHPLRGGNPPRGARCYWQIYRKMVFLVFRAISAISG
jgi:hypothetical protein